MTPMTNRNNGAGCSLHTHMYTDPYGRRKAKKRRGPLPLSSWLHTPAEVGSSNEAAASDVDTVSTSRQLSRQRVTDKKEAPGPRSCNTSSFTTVCVSLQRVRIRVPFPFFLSSTSFCFNSRHSLVLPVSLTLSYFFPDSARVLRVNFRVGT